MKLPLAVFLILSAGTIGFLAGARWDDTICSQRVTWLEGERIAREGKTDRAFYSKHPNHFSDAAVTLRAMDLRP